MHIVINILHVSSLHNLNVFPSGRQPRSITSSSSGFNDCESASSDNDLIDTFLVISSTEGGVTDLNDSIDSVTATYNTFPSSHQSDSKQSLNIITNPLSLLAFPDSNFDCDADSDIDSISNSEKVGVTYLALPIKTST